MSPQAAETAAKGRQEDVAGWECETANRDPRETRWKCQGDEPWCSFPDRTLGHEVAPRSGHFHRAI